MGEAKGEGGEARRAGLDGDVRGAITEVIERARTVALAGFEELDGEALAPLQEQSRQVLSAAIAIASTVLERLEQPPAEGPAEPPAATLGSSSQLCMQVERWAAEAHGVEQVANLAFVSVMGLRARLGAVMVIDPLTSKWELISAASSAVRDVLKSMSALDASLAELEGQPGVNRFYVTELERSLRVRRAYVLFHAAVSRLNDERSLDLKGRLRGAGAAIAKLVGREEYPTFRVHDRRMLRSFQAKLRECLLSPLDAGEAAKAVVCERLWQDLVNFAALLLLVNNRAELVDHDRRAIARAADALERGESGLGEIVEQLRFVIGRDAELDLLLTDREPAPLSAWSSVLCRCRDRFGREPSAA